MLKKKRIFGSPAWALGGEDLCVQDFQIRVECGGREGGTREWWLGDEAVEGVTRVRRSRFYRRKVSSFPAQPGVLPSQGQYERKNERTKGRVQFKDKTTTK